MDGVRAFHWTMARGKKLFLYDSVLQNGLRYWWGYPGLGLGARVTIAGRGTATSPCWIL